MSKAVRLSFGDHQYTLRPGRLTVRQISHVRKVTGQSPTSAMAELANDPDLDVVAVLYFAAAVQAGEDPNWNTIIDSATRDTPITLELVDDEPGEA